MTIDSAGNQDLRSYVQSNWQYLAVVDDSGTEVTRIDITGDSRTSWSSGSSSNPLTIDATIEGGDSDITVPVTISSLELYKTSGASTAMDSKSITDATLQASQDTVPFTYDVEIPNL